MTSSNHKKYVIYINSQIGIRCNVKYKILRPYYYSLLPKKMSKLFFFQLSISIKHSKFALTDSVDKKNQYI
jgi:hypothetical protein